MHEMPERLLLIDGNNLACRLFFAGMGLHKGNKPTDVIYGFFRQLISLHKRFPNRYPIVAWDGGYKRRLEESQKGVVAGIIPSVYKENRIKPVEGEVDEREALHTQIDQIQYLLKNVRCTQLRIEGEEADDIINTYTKKYPECQFVILSSDKDFYQLISDTVTVYDGMKDEIWDKAKFVGTYGFQPDLWVDVGALAGDNGDNIFGCDGWGPKTACRYVKEFGGLDNVLSRVADKKKRGKRESDLLNCIPRLRLARSLKGMHVIPVVPDIVPERKLVEPIKNMFSSWGFLSLLKDAWLLC